MSPSGDGAFAFDEYIMRDVGIWLGLLRYMHSTGASAFSFVDLPAHCCGGIMTGSYQKRVADLGCSGMTILPCADAEAFMGYLLPWVSA